MFCGCKAVSLAAFVAALLSAEPAFTQTPSDEATPEAKAAAPVAYVYVTRPTHIDSFTAASDGKLSAVSGSPIQGSVTGLSVNEQYLFGINSTLTDNQINSYINAYKIASDGAIALSAQTLLSTSGGSPTGPLRLQTDYSGKTLYVSVDGYDASNKLSVESFEIESEGRLKDLGNSTPDGYGNGESVPQPTILGNNKFAYNAGCNVGIGFVDPFFVTYTRESDGFMVLSSASFPMPPAYDGDSTFCSELLVGDTTDHLVVAGQYFNQNGPIFLATYTADSHGNLTTKSAPKNMATVSSELNGIYSMSIDPTGKLLAVGALGAGFQLFHWNNGEQVTNYTGVIQKNTGAGGGEFGWDKSHHLYVLSLNGELHVYTVTPSSMEEAPGSPYLIPEASSIIVLSK